MIAHKNILKDLGRILFWFPVRWFIQLSSLKHVQSIGAFLGEIDFRLFGTKRSLRMADNISKGLGISAKAAQDVVKKNLKMNITNNLELMKYPYFSKSDIDENVRFYHIERLDAELAKGKGVILLTAHFGTKQQLQVALGLSGYSVNQLHYHMESDELSFIQKNVAQKQRKKIESRIPVNFIPAKGSLRPLFDCLRNNQVLILAGDGIGLKRHMDRSYHPFDFLGKKMYFPTGPYSLARRFETVIIPVFALREGGKHQIVFETPIDVNTRDSAESVRNYVTILESYVRNYAWQWEFWEEFDEEVLLVNAQALACSEDRSDI